MKLLLFILPTVLLTAYSQLITKWRVTGMLAGQEIEVGKFARLYHYLTDPYIISAYVFSLLSSIAWLYVVEKFPVSAAFPTYVGILFMVVTFGSSLLLRETISLQHMAGLALILVGVVIVSRAA